jgi:hypothetical protein
MKEKIQERKKARSNGWLSKTEAKRIQREMKKLAKEKYALDPEIAQMWTAPLAP